MVEMTLYVDGVPVAPLELATSARSRGKGLLRREGVDGAFWLKPCRHVHSFRMRFDLDIAHVDRAGQVISVQALQRGRFGRFHLSTRSIIEAEAGAMDTWGVGTGSKVEARASA